MRCSGRRLQWRLASEGVKMGIDYCFLVFVLLALTRGSLSQRKTCTIPHSPGSDDTPAAAGIFASCSSNADVVFSANTTYNIWTPLSVNLSNVAIHVHGNLSLPTSIATVQSIVGNTTSARLTWFTVSGRDVSWLGAPTPDSGWINSHGEQWWAANARVPNGTGLPGRPHLLKWSVRGGRIMRLKSYKPIAWNVAVEGGDTLISDCVIDAVPKSGGAVSAEGFPFNTDGFGVKTQNVVIKNARIFNGDDAFVVTSGARNVTFSDSVVGYETHGLSVGSLRNNADVRSVLFRNITMIGGLFGARFKSWKGGSGLAQNIAWKDIRLSNVTFPIYVTQTYYDQGKGAPPSSGTGQDSAVNMKNFTWEGFGGTINSLQPGDGSCASVPCWYNAGLPGNITHTEAVIVQCASEESCSDFRFKNINLAPMSLPGAPARAVRTICGNLAASHNPELGIKCTNGPFEAV